jgi:serine/threonine-protein kinase
MPSDTEDDDVAPPPGSTRPAPLPALPVGFEARYRTGTLVASGGMGEVRAATDVQLEREVVMKTIRGAHAADEHVQRRFLREARVQGALQHPGVAPVYDLGTTPDGALYFTMRRVLGVTLGEAIALGRTGDPAARARFSRTRLLSALGTVCQTIAFAHDRGWVHRDLKPANVMLGDFGEVVVLDWGTAMPLGGGPDARVTRAGAVVGTPQYMAPEQALGDRLDERTDVYALGLLLFEILAGRPLRAADPDRALLAATKAANVREPLVEADAPFELIDLCERATTLGAEQRIPTVRAFRAELEQSLFGERDEEHRRVAAARHADAARRILGAMPRDPAEAEASRARALGELGRALALDPENERARVAIAGLLDDAGDELPAEAEGELRRVAEQVFVRSARFVAMNHALWLCMLPVSLLLGLRQPAWLFAMGVPLALIVALNVWVARTRRAPRPVIVALIALHLTSVAALSGFVGPLILGPAFLVSITSAMLVNLRPDRRLRTAILSGALAAVAVPLLLSNLGVLPPSYAFENGRMIVLPAMVELSPASIGLILFGSCASLVFSQLGLSGTIDTLNAAERRTLARAWKLQQLVPEVTRPSTSPDRDRTT